MQRRKFNLDIDGVSCDWLGGALPIIHKVTGRLYTREEFTTWDIYDVIGHEHAPACNVLFHAAGFCAGLQPFPGAVEGIERLRELVDVRALTSATHSPYWYYERVEWVGRYHGIEPRRVHFTFCKEDVFGDFLLDDRPNHVEDWALQHPNGIALLWDQPNNRGRDGMLTRAPGNARRVKEWDEVIAAVVAAR